MITIQKNGWKNTCGFVITIRNGSLFETKNEEGYTHFAEHMMFSGTKKLSRFKLREKYDKILNSLEATTSRDRVSLFGYFDLQDFDEAIDVLSQMMYKWKCEKENFQDEKKDIQNEIREYSTSYEKVLCGEANKLLSIPAQGVLGRPSVIKKNKI